MPKKKHHSNSKKMPIYIPNQPMYDSFWFMPNAEGLKQVHRENEFRDKLSKRKK